MSTDRVAVRRAAADDVDWIVARSGRVQDALTASGRLQKIGPLPVATVEPTVRAGFRFHGVFDTHLGFHVAVFVTPAS